ncbi:MAG: hypothetical protein ACK5LQ_03485 [Planctomycetota bacterium]|jgi:hypothetical protein
MAIEHTCQCGAKLKVKDELVGKKIKCPKCSEAIRLPAAVVPSEMISVSCQCGKAFKAKVSMAGKSFQCISCNRTIPIPGPANAASEDPDPLAMDQPNTSLGDPFDGNFPDLGLPTVAHVPYHAPITNPQPKKVEASESYDYRSAPNKNLKSNFNFNQDTWILVTAILCILHGLGRAGNLPVSILPMVASGAVFSMGGILSLAHSFICLGILIGGIGLLTQNEKSVTVGQTAASMFYVLTLIHIILFLAGLGAFTPTVASTKNYIMYAVLFFSGIIGESIAPTLLLYVTYRNR